MSSNAIGTGALILSANADRMLAGLDKAGKQATDKAAKISEGMNKAAGGKGGKGGGIGAFAGGFLGGFLGAAAGRIIEEPLNKAGNAMLNMVNRGHEFRMEIERAGELSDAMAKSLDRSLRRSDERLGAIADPAKLEQEVNRQIAAMQRMLAAEESVKAHARDDLNSLKDDGSGKSWSAFLTGNLENEMMEADQRFKAASATVGKLSDRLDDLREKSMRLKNPAGDPAVIGAVNQLTESLKLQADTFGMTANQASIFALKAKGASVEMLKMAQAEADRLDELQKATAAPNLLGGAMQQGGTEAYSLVAKFEAGNTLAASADKKREAQGREQIALLRKLVNAVAGSEILKVM